METEVGSMPVWLKRAIAIAGLLMVLFGILVMLVSCLLLLIALADGYADDVGAGIAGFVTIAICIGVGGIALLHAGNSLQGKSSAPLRLPPVLALVGCFGLFLVLGFAVSHGDFAPAVFFPPILLIVATLPPLWAVAWFAGQDSESGGLTRRRGLVAFAGGTTGSLLIALILEILLPIIIMALVHNLADNLANNMRTLLTALAGQQVASAVANPGFIYVFVQIAIIAPLAEELSKPLITLPVIGRLKRRDAFLVGAMAGAGFAAIENILYASFGFEFWAGILVVRALGSAVHPLGAGLVALGWHDVLRGKAHAWSNWLKRFGIAAGIHALWNGGSLLIVTLLGAQLFGAPPPEIDVLGLSAAGTMLALLLILGLAALWIGRATVENVDRLIPSEPKPADLQFILSDRTIAIWALACLVTIVPVGVAGLRLLLR